MSYEGGQKLCRVVYMLLLLLLCCINNQQKDGGDSPSWRQTGCC